MKPFGLRLDALQTDTATGAMFSQGIMWQLSNNDIDPGNTGRLDILYYKNGAGNSILDYNTIQVDRNTGVVSFDCTLGGKAYIDTQTGLVRFSGAIIPKSMRLYAQYNPFVLRVSSGVSANYRSASMLYDDRYLGVWSITGSPVMNLLGDLAFWFRGNNLAAQVSDPIRWDRFILAFTRTSGDGSQATRPYMRTLRFGIQLPTPIFVQPNTGAVTVLVNGATSFHQVDPATGRIYFPAEAEGSVVTVTYSAVDDTGQFIGTYTPNMTFTVGLIPETTETTVPIEQVGNESSLTLALDPLSANYNSPAVRRPGLIWMFWTSTRGGGPDVFFQTIAPRFSPLPLTR